MENKESDIESLHDAIEEYLQTLDSDEKIADVMKWPMPGDNDKGQNQWDYEFTENEKYDHDELFAKDETEDLAGLLPLVRFLYRDHENKELRATQAKRVRETAANLQVLQKTYNKFSIVLYETTWWKRGFDTYVSILDPEYGYAWRVRDLEKDITFSLFAAPKYTPKSNHPLGV
jgi:hypothetical protein